MISSSVVFRPAAKSSYMTVPVQTRTAPSPKNVSPQLKFGFTPDVFTGGLAVVIGLIGLSITGVWDYASNRMGVGPGLNRAQTQLETFHKQTEAPLAAKHLEILLEKLQTEVGAKALTPPPDLPVQKKELFNSLLDKARKARSATELSSLFEQWLREGISPENPTVNIDVLSAEAAKWFKEARDKANSQASLAIWMWISWALVGGGVLRIVANRGEIE